MTRVPAQNLYLQLSGPRVDLHWEVAGHLPASRQLLLSQNLPTKVKGDSKVVYSAFLQKVQALDESKRER
jgi:hypothetical protein